MIIDVRPVSKVWVRMAWRSESKWTSVWSPAGLTTGCGGRRSADSFRFNLVRTMSEPELDELRGRLRRSPLLMTSTSEMSRYH
jgi:hypothetical protein